MCSINGIVGLLRTFYMFGGDIMATADIKNSNYLLPDMGDYYFDSIDHKLYATIADSLSQDSNKGKSGPALAKFYTEDPMDLGYNPQYKTYSIEVKLPSNRSMNGEKMGDITIIDGDTIILKGSSLYANDTETKQYIEQITKKQKAVLTQIGGNDNSAFLSLRFACIDAPELPHFSPCGPSALYESWTDFPTQKKTFQSAYEDSDFAVSKYYSHLQTGNKYDLRTTIGIDGSNNPELDFVKVGNKYYQYFDNGSIR